MTQLTERLLKNIIKVLKTLIYLAAHPARNKHYFQSVSNISITSLLITKMYSTMYVRH